MSVPICICMYVKWLLGTVITYLSGSGGQGSFVTVHVEHDDFDIVHSHGVSARFAPLTKTRLYIVYILYLLVLVTSPLGSNSRIGFF